MAQRNRATRDGLPQEVMRGLVASRLGATLRVGGGQPGKLVSLDEALDAYVADRRRDRRLAVAITGGGGRGAWEAGVVEALTAACRSRDIRVDVVVGASVGAINALCTFVDALAPPTTPVGGVFSARQSRFWKRYATGNNGADQLLDLSWIISYATNQVAIPGPGTFADGSRQLQDAWAAAGRELGAIGKAAGRVRNAIASRPPGDLTEETGLALQQLGSTSTPCCVMAATSRTHGGTCTSRTYSSILEASRTSLTRSEGFSATLPATSVG